MPGEDYSLENYHLCIIFAKKHQKIIIQIIKRKKYIIKMLSSILNLKKNIEKLSFLNFGSN